MKRLIMAALVTAVTSPALSQTPRAAVPPTMRLLTGYAAFAHVKWCHDVREGYAFQAISAAEIERAHTVVKSVEAQATKEDATINTDRLWQMGLEIASRHREPRKVTQPGFAEVCRDVLRQLYELSPVPVYHIAKP